MPLLTTHVKQIAYWFYNVSAEEKFHAVYGDGPFYGNYKEEKIDMINRGIHIWWGTLDDEHQQRLVDHVNLKYNF
jgi:hypothetical protein